MVQKLSFGGETKFRYSEDKNMLNHYIDVVGITALSLRQRMELLMFIVVDHSFLISSFGEYEYILRDSIYLQNRRAS